MGALAPKKQGRGIGGRVLEAVMQSLVDKAGGLPVMLMTQEGATVRLYERHGFRVLDHRRIEIGEGEGDGFDNRIKSEVWATVPTAFESLQPFLGCAPYLLY